MPSLREFCRRMLRHGYFVDPDTAHNIAFMQRWQSHIQNRIDDIYLSQETALNSMIGHFVEQHLLQPDWIYCIQCMELHENYLYIISTLDRHWELHSMLSDYLRNVSMRRCSA